MGGEAIIPIIGKPAERFNVKTRNLFISSLSPISDLVPIREIKEKQDFGDIDFFCSSSFKNCLIAKFVLSDPVLGVEANSIKVAKAEERFEVDVDEPDGGV